eukprot:TRINITY_DN15449_c0_g2_i2.p1 TRINITY_DN15449_c0_g2~~TRINITY_DN15449_c0_g2_i2.p1  ORF type:complete len:1040 (-),score=215.93 TRINITY_DN15449_c0_g2_i2:130-3249(-)
MPHVSSARPTWADGPAKRSVMQDPCSWCPSLPALRTPRPSAENVATPTKSEKAALVLGELAERSESFRQASLLEELAFTLVAPTSRRVAGKATAVRRPHSTIAARQKKCIGLDSGATYAASELDVKKMSSPCGMARSAPAGQAVKNMRFESDLASLGERDYRSDGDSEETSDASISSTSQGSSTEATRVRDTFIPQCGLLLRLRKKESYEPVAAAAPLKDRAKVDLTQMPVGARSGSVLRTPGGARDAAGKLGRLTAVGCAADMAIGLATSSFDRATMQRMANTRSESFESFSLEEVQRHTKVYRRYVQQGEAEVHVETLPDVLAALGYLHCSWQEIMGDVEQFTRCRTVSLDEFLEFAAIQVRNEYKVIRKTFDKFDDDGSGYLETSELLSVLRALGVHPVPSALEETLGLVDEDKNGVVDFEEFTMLLMLYRVTAGFKLVELGGLQRTYTAYQSPSGKLSPLRLQIALLDFFGPMSKSIYNDSLAEAVSNIISRGEELTFQDFLFWAQRMREAEVLTFEHIFMMYHSDSSEEKADRDELNKMLRALGHTPLRNTVDTLLEDLDMSADAAGVVDMQGFVTLVQSLRQRDGFTDEEAEDLKATFDLFDAKGTGFIDCQQLVDLLRHRSQGVQLHEVQALMGQVNLDSSCQLSFASLLRLMRIHREKELHEMQQVFDLFKDNTGNVQFSQLLSMLEKLNWKQDRTGLERFSSSTGLEMCFDDFVQIVDKYRELVLEERRINAGLSDEEVTFFSNMFNNYDKDGSGSLERLELVKLLMEMEIPMDTQEDQRAFMDVLQKAHARALTAGVRPEDAGDPSRPIVTLPLMLHLLKTYRLEDELKFLTEETEAAAELHLHPDEVMDLRAVFQRYAQVGVEAMWKEPELKICFNSVVYILGSLDVDLSFSDVRRLRLKACELELARDNVGDEDGATALAGETIGDYDAVSLGFPDFLRLVRWIVDDNLGGVNDVTSKHLTKQAGTSSTKTFERKKAAIEYGRAQKSKHVQFSERLSVISRQVNTALKSDAADLQSVAEESSKARAE